MSTHHTEAEKAAATAMTKLIEAQVQMNKVLNPDEAEDQPVDDAAWVTAMKTLADAGKHLENTLMYPRQR